MAGKNPWTTFLKEYMKKQGKGQSLKDSMKKASVLYRAQKSGVSKKKRQKGVEQSKV